MAKIFLGDVGSLPIGLLLGWCLLQLAYGQQFAAALLLPLYYLADATVTLLRRMIRREPFWAAHRSHFYQRATDNGFTVLRVVSEVFALNVGSGGAGDRLDHDAIGRDRRRLHDHRRLWRGTDDVPVFAAAARVVLMLQFIQDQSSSP